MRFAHSSLTALTLAACATLAAAASAEAGTITAATGEFAVNGKATTIEPGKTITVKPGDQIDTKKANVSYKTDTGDALLVEAGSLVREEPTTEVAAGLFILRGSVTGTLSDKTQLGAAPGWMTAGKDSKARVLVESAAGHEDKQALFRSIEGGSSVTYHAFTAHLPPAHSLTLSIDPSAPGTVLFRTGQQNAGEVRIDKTTSSGQMIAYVPKASLGRVTDEPGNKTRICSDINSLKTAKIRLETKFGSSKNDASIGPGTCAVIDNATGAIELAFSAVRFEILETAITLTSEFSTLAQSNFSDVK